jgi:hypothetical protein
MYRIYRHAEDLSPQITKNDWVRKSQIRKVPHLQRLRTESADLTNYFSWRICKTYLWTVHL